MKSGKDFYNFVKSYNTEICDLYEDFCNRKDPEPGDIFLTPSIFNSLMGKSTFDKMVYEGVDYDSLFDNGIAFIYSFHLLTDENTKIHIRSINKVDDPSKLSDEDRKDLYGFWRKCHPLKLND